MKKTFQSEVVVKGIANSKELAINQALGKIQKQMMTEHKGLMLRIEPLDVQVIEAKEFTYTERFLFFFFPRKRQKFSVSLSVLVQVFLIDVEKIPFEKSEVKDNLRNFVLGHQVK